MPALPDVILQNVLRNVSNGLTYGQVAILNMSSSGESPPLDEMTTPIPPTTSPTSSLIVNAINGTLNYLNSSTLASNNNHDDVMDRITTESSVVCLNRTLVPNPTEIGEIPAKEIIIVILMLSLWIYSIVETWKLWHKILK